MYKKPLTRLISIGLICILALLSSCVSSDRSSGFSAKDYYEMGNEYYHNDDLRQAEAMYKKSVRVDPQYAPSYTQLGYVYCDFCEIALFNNDLTEANKYYNLSYNCFHAALKYQPASPSGGSKARPYLGLALLYISSGTPKRLDQAIEMLIKARQTEPEDIIIRAQAYYHLGRCYNLQGKYQAALKEFKEYLNLMPTGPDAKNVKYAIKIIERELKKKTP